jgi:hypothetical protein
MMDPNISRTNATRQGTAGAGQAAEEQSLSPQANANKTTKRANASRGSTREQGVSLSPPTTQTGRKNGSGRANSS